MRILSVSVKGLFDLFDHEVPFNKSERVTIIHGPNGVGKTTILRLLHDLFTLRFNSLRITPFRSLSIHFDQPKRSLTLQRIIENEDRPPCLSFALAEGGKKSEYTEKRPRPKIRPPLRRWPPFDYFLPFLERVRPDRWLDTLSSEILDANDVLARYGKELPSDLQESLLPDFPEWLIGFLRKLPVHFIQTQRLFAEQFAAAERHNKPRKHSTTVEMYSEEMTGRIQESLKKYGVIGASLDRTFPHRLLRTTFPKGATEERIRVRYKEQAEYRSRLMAAGLMDTESPVELPAGSLDKNARGVLWHYLNDVDEKFVVFDSLLKRVELFKDIINTRFLYKRFSVDKERGFVFKTERGTVVPLKTLSSGEQHELVLAFDLLFRVKEGSMILIDEPELSLHVTWQHKFLEDIGRISGLADLDFLVATHSPSIIHNKTQLMVSLGEEN